MMDLSTGVGVATRWAATSYELHSAAANWSDAVDRRVADELASTLLTRGDWGGDAPFAPFENPLLPGPSSYPGDVLVQRTLFKVESWSAPALGGVARGFFSDDQTGWTTKPRLVLDFATVGGRSRLVAMHRPCPRCKTTSVGKSGGPCDYTSRGEVPCTDGLLFEGGLRFDRGTLHGRERLVDPDPKWAGLMAR